MMTRANKSLQATRDGRSSSAVAEDVIRPACLSWTFGGSSYHSEFKTAQRERKHMPTELFANLTVDEKRAALDFDEFYLQSILDARQGKAQVIEVGFDNKFVERMTDEDIREAIELTRLQKRALAASEAGIHGRLFVTSSRFAQKPLSIPSR
jgi:hypothetical protein